MEAIDLLGVQSGADKWRRLAPAAIIHFIVQFFVQLLKQGIQGLLPLAAVLFTAGEDRWVVISAIAIGGAVVLLAGAVLSYLKFKFRLSGETFLIHKGVFKRKRLSLGYDRIQNVVIKQPVYFRPFNLVVLVIESAGSSGEEVSLAGIPRSLAEEIRTAVFARRKEAKESAAATQEATSEPQSVEDDVQEIIRQPVPELIRYGLSNNQVWVFAGVVTGAMAQIEWEDLWFYEQIEKVGNEIAAFGQTGALIIGISGVLAIFLLLLTFSAIGAIIIYFDYHLTRAGGRFHRTKGLFEKQESSLPEGKIQALVMRQAWPAKLLKRFHLELKQVGFSGMGADGNVHTNQNKFLVPSVTRSFAGDFSKILYPDFDWNEQHLKAIDPSFTRKVVLWIMLPIAALPTTSLSIIFAPQFLGLLLVPFLLWPFVALRRRRYGYLRTNTHGLLRSGFVGHKLTAFPFYKVQTVQLWQSPGQRRKRLATLTIKLAGTSCTIPYMPLAEAEAWRDRILFEIERSNRTWM
jgi:putative membrane protein